MDDLILPILALFVLAVIISAIVLPIVALVISIGSRKKLNETIALLEAARSSIPGAQPADDASLAQGIQQLNARLQRIEVTLAAHSIFPKSVSEPPRPDIEPIEPSESRQTHEASPERVGTPSTSPQPRETVLADVPPLPPPTAPDRQQPPLMPGAATVRPIHTLNANQIESIIGRRLVGWAAVALILFATAFFLKYAFENRWIGELGRVAIGIALGVGMVAMGYKYQLRRWRIFSQILTAGGVVLLYLSSYAAFGYYHLVTQKVAFVFLAILIAEAAGLALLYNAPAIAIMALVGGFLTPILMHSDRDQYRSLFIYIVALDLGALALLKRWRGLTSVAYFGTQLLFWLWYNENYHPQKRLAVLIFQTVIFLIFLLAHLGKGLIRREVATIEDLALLSINPFIFFVTTYNLLNNDHHEWMGVFAIGMALLYAGATKVLLEREKETGPTLRLERPLVTNRSELLLMIGIALTFVTIAIPIQFRSNWITIAWGIEALIILWAGLEIRSLRLRVIACILFGLALAKLFFWDTNFFFRPIFTPILNRYFLSSLVVVGCLFAASILYQKAEERKRIYTSQVNVIFLLLAILTLWFVMSVETVTFFSAQAATQRIAEDAAHRRWLGQMALSVLWAAYATVLAAAGFIRRSSSVRWAALVLFGITIVKAMLVDIAQLQQIYRIIVFFVLGVLLLLVAWGYHKAFHSRELLK
jgi:uncharacterized membrane protein